MEKNIENKLSALQAKLQSIKAGDFMTTNIITASENMSIVDIADFMINKRISGLPVTSDNGQLSGIITTTDLFTLIDIIRSGSIKENALNPKVSFAMSTNIISISKDTTLEQIIVMMKQHNIHTLPVCEEGKMIGIVGRRDVFKNFYSAAKSIADH